MVPRLKVNNNQVSDKSFGANRVSLDIQRRLDALNEKHFVNKTFKLADNLNVSCSLSNF